MGGHDKLETTLSDVLVAIARSWLLEQPPPPPVSPHPGTPEAGRRGEDQEAGVRLAEAAADHAVTDATTDLEPPNPDHNTDAVRQSHAENTAVAPSAAPLAARAIRILLGRSRLYATTVTTAAAATSRPRLRLDRHAWRLAAELLRPRLLPSSSLAPPTNAGTATAIPAVVLADALPSLARRADHDGDASVGASVGSVGSTSRTARSLLRLLGRTLDSKSRSDRDVVIEAAFAHVRFGLLDDAYQILSRFAAVHPFTEDAHFRGCAGLVSCLAWLVYVLKHRRELASDLDFRFEDGYFEESDLRSVYFRDSIVHFDACVRAQGGFANDLFVLVYAKGPAGQAPLLRKFFESDPSNPNAVRVAGDRPDADCWSSRMQWWLEFHVPFIADILEVPPALPLEIAVPKAASLAIIFGPNRRLLHLFPSLDPGCASAALDATTTLSNHLADLGLTFAEVFGHDPTHLDIHKDGIVENSYVRRLHEFGPADDRELPRPHPEVELRDSALPAPNPPAATTRPTCLAPVIVDPPRFAPLPRLEDEDALFDQFPPDVYDDDDEDEDDEDDDDGNVHDDGGDSDEDARRSDGNDAAVRHDAAAMEAEEVEGRQPGPSVADRDRRRARTLRRSASTAPSIAATARKRLRTN
ncbi:hypothetical protein HK405_001429 [Cladochytrium tenue]|nr:hypothetical protein HK405_001429 [Cladochytrium tenue]